MLPEKKYTRMYLMLFYRGRRDYRKTVLLAKWLMDPKNPLTARVAVNRYWQIYFGMGLQKTADNFGNQGSFPTHPELLDWLAVIFRESGWDVKALQKLIVLSSTYRQSSYANPELLPKTPTTASLQEPILQDVCGNDPRCGTYRKRLAFATRSGEKVKPYQPEGLWRVNSEVYVQDTGISTFTGEACILLEKNESPTLHGHLLTLRSGAVVWCSVKKQVRHCSR